MIIYFSIAGFLDFSHLIDYRYFNIFFQAIGAFLGLRHFHRSDESNKTNYISGFVLAAGISAFASLIFSIYIYIYMSVIAPEFGHTVREAVPFEAISVFAMSAIGFVEGIMGGLMVAFLSMQYFKNVH